MSNNIKLKKHLLDISIVIPSLGEKSLLKTIDAILDSSVSVKEIIICIPKNFEIKTNFKNINSNIIKILKSPKKNQIFQRIQGFKIASSKFVMQLDSDILIDKFCIEKMYETILSHGSKSAVGGFIINKNKINKNSSKLLNLFKNFLINNTFYIRNWTITKSGLGYGFTGNVDNLLIEDVEWISGGCMIHYKENLIYENFIIFEGKAYYEDLVHSFLLRQNKIQLLLNYTAKCTHNNHENIYNLCIVDFFNYFANEYKSRKYFVKLAKLNYLNLNLWSLVILIKYFLNKIFNFVNK